MPRVKSSLPALLRRHNTLQRLAQPTSLRLASFNAAMATAPDLSNKTSPPWYAAYPAPRHLQPGCVTREELLWMLKGGANVAGRDFLLVDLRRADYEVRFLRVWCRVVSHGLLLGSLRVMPLSRLCCAESASH